MWKKLLIGLVIVVVVAGLLYKNATATKPVRAAAVRQGAIRQFIDERAKTSLPSVLKVTMPLAGRIKPITLSVGDAVTQGQVLAALDTPDLDTAVAQAQARVQAIEARLAVKEDNSIEQTAAEEIEKWIRSVASSVQASAEKVKASEVRKDYDEWWRETAERMRKEGAGTERDLREARTAAAESVVNLRADQFTFSAMEMVEVASKIWPRYIEQYLAKKKLEHKVLVRELEEARAAFEQARRDRNRAQVVSPITGVVLQREIENEQVLPAGATLMTVGDLTKLEVTADVLSEDAMAIRVGDPVDIFGSVAAGTLTGKVRLVEPEGFTKLSSLGVEQQRVNVVIRIDPETLTSLRESGHQLGVDYRVRVRIYTGQADDALIVPRTALFHGADGGWQVFAIREGRARKVAVEVGLLNSQEAEIRAGLTATDQVILAPEAALADGARVSVEP